MISLKVTLFPTVIKENQGYLEYQEQKLQLLYAKKDIQCAGGRVNYSNFQSLESQRVRGDLITIFKQVNGLNKGNINKILIVEEERTRDNELQLLNFWLCCEIKS